MYGEDMAKASPATCRHPAIGEQDPWESAIASDQYATKHVPFVYFHAVIDDQARCDAHVVDLAAAEADFASVANTPNFSFITPDLCSDGHDADCANPDQKGGYPGMDDFLQGWVPRILASPAYQKDGLLVVAFDESDSPDSDSTACCNEQPGYNTPRAGLAGPGGGRTGAVLLSPCVEPGSRDRTPYNHYSLLRTVEDIFGLAHLGYAGQAGLAPIGLGACGPPAPAA
jgi:hypothetical protein